LKTLFYKLLYDKRIKRSIIILEMLYKANNDIAIKELEEQLSSSKKTILTTIDYLKTLLPAECSLSIIEKRVQLHNDSKQTMDRAIIEIAKQSISFQILEHAFLDKPMNIHELAKKMFVSESTLRTRIKHMNKTLDIFDCQLSFYDVKLLGDEVNIRYFGYAYFSEFQKLHISIGEKQLEVCLQVYTGVKRRLQQYDDKLEGYSYQQIIRWLLLTKERLEVKKYVNIELGFIKRIQKQSAYKVFEIVYRTEIAKHWGVSELPKSEIVWAYIVSLHTIIYSNDEKRVLHCAKENNQLPKEKIVLLLEKIMDIFCIAQEDKKEFLALHMAYLVNLSLLTELSPIFQLGSSKVKDYIINNLESLYNIWYECLINVNKEDLFLIYNIQSMSAQLAMISSQFIYEQKVQAKKVLYSFEGEAGLVAYLEALAKTVLPKGIEGVFVYSEPITAALIEQIQPDIVVYNYEMKEEIIGCKIFRLSYIPQNKEWTYLKRAIINLNDDYLKHVKE